MNHQLDFFMGAVSPAGFYNCFPNLSQQADLVLYLLKSGPGCGKSTLMRDLSERAQGPIEHIHCSSDPDSLDAAILWKNHAAILDATAPHVMEPQYPGVKEHVVNLYDALNAQRLSTYQEEIPRLFDVCHVLHQRAERYIHASGSLIQENYQAADTFLDQHKTIRYAQHLAAREIPHSGHASSEQLRFLSAITLKGILVYRSTVPKLAKRVVVFHDEYGAASRLILKTLRETALAKGHAIISCPCSMAPNKKLEHLFLPELGLAFLTSNSWHSFDLPGQQNVHCSRFIDTEHLSQCRQRLHFNRRAASELLKQASYLQQEAKHNHDQLEKLYQSGIDFTLVDAVRENLAHKLGL